MISQIFPHCHFHWLKLLSPSLQPLPFEHYSLKFKHSILIFTSPSSMSNKTTLTPWRSSNQRVLFPSPITYFNYQGKKKKMLRNSPNTLSSYLTQPSLPAQGYSSPRPWVTVKTLPSLMQSRNKHISFPID